MEVVNPFILKNKIGMVKFVDELCNVDFNDPILVDKPKIDNNNNYGNENSNNDDDDVPDPAQHLAIVHNICEKYRTELEQLASSSQAARKLVTIITILSQHKQYYNNLRRNAQLSITSTSV